MNDTTNMVCTYQDFVKAFQKIGYSIKKKPPCCTFCRVGHTGGMTLSRRARCLPALKDKDDVELLPGILCGIRQRLRLVVCDVLNT